MFPCRYNKWACTRPWQDSTLAATLGVADAEVKELPSALDWLLARPGRIERKLAARHLAAVERRVGAPGTGDDGRIPRAIGTRERLLAADASDGGCRVLGRCESNASY